MANQLYTAIVNGRIKGQALSFIPPSITNSYGLPTFLIIGYRYEHDKNLSDKGFKPNAAFIETIKEFCESALVADIKSKGIKLSNNEHLYIIDQRNSDSDKAEDVIGVISKSNENNVEFKINPNYIPLTESGPISFGGDMDKKFYDFMINKISR